MRRRLSCLLLAAALLLSGCAGRQDAEETGLRVVCTLFPYYDFVRVIGGEDVSAQLLVPAGRETHSFEPTPLDLVDMAQAELLICNGGESETWVEEILDAIGEDMGPVLRMMDYADALEEEHSEGMQGSHEHEDHDHDHDGHQEEIEYDEHIWTSPRQSMELCRAICEALCQVDPDHEAGYRQRLADYLAQLEALDAAFQAVVEGGQRRMLIFGDRFPLLYFVKEYDLDYRAAFHGCAGDTEPSLGTLKYLIDKVQEDDIPVVYTIECSSQKVAQAIAETTGARVLTFHSCQTVTRQELQAGESYLSLMWKNVEALQEGLT